MCANLGRTHMCLDSPTSPHNPRPRPVLRWCVIIRGESGTLFITHHIPLESDRNTHTHTHTHNQKTKMKPNRNLVLSCTRHWGWDGRREGKDRPGSPTKDRRRTRKLQGQEYSPFSTELCQTHLEQSHVNFPSPPPTTPKPQSPLWPWSELRFPYEAWALFQSSHLPL